MMSGDACFAGPSSKAPNVADRVTFVTKEWVVPERPKPGRKPKDPEAAAKRRANLGSQRSFRERRQEYVAELEARVKALEQGEGEKAVFFQQQAVQYKEETEVLKASNGTLQKHVDTLRQEVERLRKVVKVKAKKATAVVEQLASPPSKRARTTAEPALASSGCQFCSNGSPCLCKIAAEHTFTPPSSHSVPLRLLKRSSDAAATPRVWEYTVQRAPVDSVAREGCNGDRSTCPACRDDPRGQVFCQALATSVCSSNPCSNCPKSCAASTSTSSTVLTLEEEDPVDTFTDIPCCGDPSLCGSQTCQPQPTTIRQCNDTIVEEESTSGLACSDAWIQLRSHPNIDHANLHLLADVVARRTRCDNELEARGRSPVDVATTAGKRKLTVEREGVKEALAMLDRVGQHHNSLIYM